MSIDFHINMTIKDFVRRFGKFLLFCFLALLYSIAVVLQQRLTRNSNNIAEKSLMIE